MQASLAFLYCLQRIDARSWRRAASCRSAAVGAALSAAMGLVSWVVLYADEPEGAESVRERRAPWSPGRRRRRRAPGPSAASVLRTCRGASSLAPLATPPEVEVLRRRRIFLPFQGSGGVLFGTFPVRHLLRLDVTRSYTIISTGKVRWPETKSRF